MHIGYFVSAHGFGHSARARTVIKSFPKAVKVTLFTATPAWFWKDTNCSIVRFSADVGCIQTDTFTIDSQGTARAVHEHLRNRMMRLQVITDIHRNDPFDIIVSDIAPEPLAFGKNLNIPSVLIANFTWIEIYQGFPELQFVIPELLADYHLATRVLIPCFKTGMDWLLDSEMVPVIVSKGESKRNLLNTHNLYSKLVYVDCGRWGTSVQWSHAKKSASTLFIKVGDDIPDAPSNVLSIPYGLYRHTDIVASVDLVLSKPGYGIVSECLVNRTSWMCIPRQDFEEDVHLIDGALNDRICVIGSIDQLVKLDALDGSVPPSESIFTYNGADKCVQHICQLAGISG